MKTIRWIKFLIFIVMVSLITGCETDNSDNSNSSGPDFSSSTGIIPLNGSYNFDCILQQYNHISFKVMNDGQFIRFTMDGYTFYDIPISNGQFYYLNGLSWGGTSDSGNAYPTDSFAISGHFIALNQAEGSISSSYIGGVDKSIFDNAPFTATR